MRLMIRKLFKDNTKCECCEDDKVQWTLKDSDNPKVIYKVCPNCLLHLTTFSLRPNEFKNLLKNGHTIEEILLNDTFYNENGESL